MKDKKARKRAEMSRLEQRQMLARYKSECRELGTRMETPEEKQKRIKRIEQEKRHRERYWIRDRSKDNATED